MSFDFISMINYKFVNITNRERKRDAKMNRLVKNFVRDAGEIVLYNYYHFNVSFFFSPSLLSTSFKEEEKAGYKVNSIRGLLTTFTN